MRTYLKNLLEEKRICLETRIEVEGPSGTNNMPLQMVVDAINGTSQGEKDQIRKTLVMIDFKNGDVMHFFKHLAQALAK